MSKAGKRKELKMPTGPSMEPVEGIRLSVWRYPSTTLAASSFPCYRKLPRLLLPGGNQRRPDGNSSLVRQAA